MKLKFQSLETELVQVQDKMLQVADKTALYKLMCR